LNSDLPGLDSVLNTSRGWKNCGMKPGI
jgi:hypothetical protein